MGTRRGALSGVEGGRDGRVAWSGYETWYRVVGDLGTGPPPLVVIHGGPGTPHDYLASVADVAEGGRPCVFYDQIGSNGRSSQQLGEGSSIWTVELFLEEIDRLIEHLGIGSRYHLLGHSWGGMLALEHALCHPPGLRSIVVANAPASIPLWAETARTLTAQIAMELRAGDRGAALADRTADPREVKRIYYARHVCRLAEMPEEFLRVRAAREKDPSVYTAMIGASIDVPTGSLASWDIRPRLRGIRTPTLVICGRHDETPPEVVGPIADGIADSRMVVFERSGHSPHLEQRAEFVATVSQYLADHDEDG